MHVSSSFTFDSAEQMAAVFAKQEDGFIYSRFDNPTVRAFELKMAALEETEDADLVWRNFINHKLTNEYERLFARLDLMVTLQAPSFSCVFEWRRQQEEQLIERNANVGGNTLQTFNTDQLSRFIAHFQRLTEWGLKTMPLKADFTLMLSSDHDITHLDTKPAETP